MTSSRNVKPCCSSLHLTVTVGIGANCSATGVPPGPDAEPLTVRFACPGPTVSNNNAASRPVPATPVVSPGRTIAISSLPADAIALLCESRLDPARAEERSFLRDTHAQHRRVVGHGQRHAGDLRRAGDRDRHGIRASANPEFLRDGHEDLPASRQTSYRQGPWARPSPAPPPSPAGAEAALAAAAAVAGRAPSAAQMPAAREAPGPVQVAAPPYPSRLAAAAAAARAAAADRSIRDWPACRCESDRRPAA